jgi:hypothetical protein
LSQIYNKKDIDNMLEFLDKKFQIPENCLAYRYIDKKNIDPIYDEIIILVNPTDSEKVFEIPTNSDYEFFMKNNRFKKEKVTGNKILLKKRKGCIIIKRAK